LKFEHSIVRLAQRREIQREGDFVYKTAFAKAGIAATVERRDWA
jgi:hypothetical protein